MKYVNKSRKKRREISFEETSEHISLCTIGCRQSPGGTWACLFLVHWLYRHFGSESRVLTTTESEGGIKTMYA